MHGPFHLQHLPSNTNQTADPPLYAHQQPDHWQGIGEVLQPPQIIYMMS